MKPTNTFSKTMILVAVLLAPLIRPNGINGLTNGGQYIFDGLSVVSVMVLLILFFAQEKQLMDRQLILCGLIFLLIMVSTLKNHGDKMVNLRVAVTCFGIMLAAIVFRKKPKMFMSALLLDLEVLIYLNALCLILFPKGMYLSHETYGSSTNWLMGYDNHWFIFYYGAYFLALVNILYGGSMIRSYLLIAVLHVTALFTMSGVLVAGILLMDVILFFRLYQWKIFRFETILAGSLFLTVALIFFQTNEAIQYAITQIFNKEDSMSARARIWRGAIALVKQHLLFGNGRLFAKDAQRIYGLPAAINAHNMWLEILLEGGVITLALFILFLLLSARKIGKQQSVFYQLLLIPVATAFVMMAVDAFIETRGVMFFALLAVGKYCDDYEAAVVPERALAFERKREKTRLRDLIGGLRRALVFGRVLPMREQPRKER